MKHAALVLILTLSLTPLLAQDNSTTTTPPDQPNNIASATKPNFFPRLGLSDDQKAKITEIRSSVKEPGERRQQVLAVLDNAQRMELRRMIRDWNREHPRTPSSPTDLGDQDPNQTSN